MELVIRNSESSDFSTLSSPINLFSIFQVKIKEWILFHPKLTIFMTTGVVIGGISYYFLEKRKSKPSFFPNQFSDYFGSGKVKIPFEKLKLELEKNIERLLKEFPPEKCGKKNNITLYSGPLGICYLFLHLYDSWPPEETEKRKKFLDYALQYFQMAEQIFIHTPSDLLDSICSFYGGFPAFHAIAAVLYDRREEVLKSLASVEKFIDISKEESNFKSLDVLWGAIGYLNGCAFLNSSLRENIIPKEVVDKVFNKIIEDGKNTPYQIQEANGFPPWIFVPFYDFSSTKAFFVHEYGRILGNVLVRLFHSRLKKICYVGMAHGISGALFTFCNFNHLLNHEPNKVLFSKMADHLVSLQKLDGNFPLSTNPKFSTSTNIVVQCGNGAPGIAIMMSKMYQLYQDEKYLLSAIKAADFTWKYGLSGTGNGLYNGTIGNGYVFLSLYNVTGEEKYLHRAVQFAEFSSSEEAQKLEKKGSYPYSLFEGLPGSILFYSDILYHSKGAHFPAVQFN